MKRLQVSPGGFGAHELAESSLDRDGLVGALESKPARPGHTVHGDAASGRAVSQRDGSGDGAPMQANPGLSEFTGARQADRENYPGGAGTRRVLRQDGAHAQRRVPCPWRCGQLAEPPPRCG